MVGTTPFYLVCSPFCESVYGYCLTIMSPCNPFFLNVSKLVHLGSGDVSEPCDQINVMWSRDLICREEYVNDSISSTARF